MWLAEWILASPHLWTAFCGISATGTLLFMLFLGITCQSYHSQASGGSSLQKSCGWRDQISCVSSLVAQQASFALSVAPLNHRLACEWWLLYIIVYYPSLSYVFFPLFVCVCLYDVIGLGLVRLFTLSLLAYQRPGLCGSQPKRHESYISELLHLRASALSTRLASHPRTRPLRCLVRLAEAILQRTQITTQLREAIDLYAASPSDQRKLCFCPNFYKKVAAFWVHTRWFHAGASMPFRTLFTQETSLLHLIQNESVVLPM